MTTYKCKLTISMLERETYLSCSENRRRTPKIKRFRVVTKIGSVGLVETNTPYTRVTCMMLIVPLLKFA